MSKQIFVNLPVRDIKNATRFYAALGAIKNPQFSDETASCMVFSDSIFVMLLKVDINPKQDHGFMYGRSFEDLDGHIWEPMFLDMSRMPKGG